MKVLWVFFDKIRILFIFFLFFNSWEKFSTDRMPDGKYIHIKILCEWHAIKCVSWLIQQQVERIRLTVCVCVCWNRWKGNINVSNHIQRMNEVFLHFLYTAKVWHCTFYYLFIRWHSYLEICSILPCWARYWYKLGFLGW